MIVKTTSHRGRRELARLVDLGPGYYRVVLTGKYPGFETGYYIIPDGSLTDVRLPKGVQFPKRLTEADLRQCWSSR